MRTRKQRTPHQVRLDEIVQESVERDSERARAPKTKRAFVAVPVWPLVQLGPQELDGDEQRLKKAIAGALVKVVVELRPSERESFDGPAVRRRLLGLGARAVVLAPKVVPEAPKEPDKVARAESPQQSVAAWFDSLPATVDKDDRERARELALQHVDRAEAER